ncbi:MAG: tungsten ABC transporter substrate-binding protein [Dehalococcoidia bacterium]|nr:tungsten ABC transporter substrate-binding protein [Dehalococcoidia bacterium]
MSLARRLLVLPALCALVFAAACGGSDDDPGTIILATTTSTYDSGLLDELVPRFEERTGITVKVIAVGTGAALRMAGEGNADAVLVHAPEAEAPYVASGDLVSSRLVMTNDFVIVGPPDDPARAASASDLPAALAAIAADGRFVSRGDDSGTHKRELALWGTAGIDPSALPREETGQGMGATLTIASERRAYTLTDRATYLALRDVLDLTVFVEGDASLLNPYHVHVVNPDRHDGVAAEQAEAFAAFLLEPATQALIGRFRAEEFGRSLFTPALESPVGGG